MPPLRAYAVDIAGSLVGIAVFTVLSAACDVAARLVPRRRGARLSLGGLGAGLTRASTVSAVAMVGVIGLAILSGGRGDTWSPYYRISIATTAGI